MHACNADMHAYMHPFSQSYIPSVRQPVRQSVSQSVSQQYMHSHMQMYITKSSRICQQLFQLMDTNTLSTFTIRQNLADLHGDGPQPINLPPRSLLLSHLILLSLLQYVRPYLFHAISYCSYYTACVSERWIESYCNTHNATQGAHKRRCWRKDEQRQSDETYLHNCLLFSRQIHIWALLGFSVTVTRLEVCRPRGMPRNGPATCVSYQRRCDHLVPRLLTAHSKFARTHAPALGFAKAISLCSLLLGTQN